MNARNRPKSIVTKDQAGFSMVVVLVLFLFLGIVGGSLCSVLSEATVSGLSRLHSAKAHYIAQSGLQWVLYNRTSFSGEASFGGGTMSLVEKNQWRYEVKAVVGDTERRVRGYRSMEYFPGTRDENTSPEDIHFHVQNQTGYWIGFDSFKIEWAGQTAYYAEVYMTENNETSVEKVWDSGWLGGYRGGSDEKMSMGFTRWVAPGETVEVHFKDFESSRYGGLDRDMSDVPLKLYFYNGSYNYQFTVVGVD